MVSTALFNESRCALSLVCVLLLVPLAFAAPPSCKVISGRHGGPAIVINDRTFSPMFMTVNNQFGRDDILRDEIRLAGEAGIGLISFNLGLDWHQSADDAARTVAKFCEANPNAYFYVRIWVGPNQPWLDAHPDDCLTAADGTQPMMASPSSAAWLEEAAAQLERRIAEIVSGPYGDRFLGAMPTYLQTGEWFYPETDKYWDYSTANQRAFRAWLKRKYRRNKALQAAWGDPNVTFDSATIPPPESREAASIAPFRDPVAHRPAADLALFQSDVMVNAIDTFCRTIKSATRKRALAGAFYGYTFELNHNGPRALAHSGHLALAKLLESPNIDLIHAPYAYFERTLGEPGHFHFPVDSIPLHGKLAIIEEDSYTHLALEPTSDLIAPGWRQRTTTLDETFALNRRNIGQFLMHRAGFWWFDLLSDGRWNSAEFWAQTGMLRRIAAQVRDNPVFEPQIAFVIDEQSVTALADTTHPYLLESIARWRAELARIGAPVGYYLQSDLAKIPRSVRLLILANPYQLPRDHQNEIRRRLDQGVTVVWTFAPGVATEDGIDLVRINEVTRMPVERVESSGPVQLETLDTGESWQMPAEWALRFAVRDSGATPLATYAGSDEIAVAEVPSGKGHVVYTAFPRLPIGLLQRLAARAGVHLYRVNGGMVAITPGYLFVHTGTESEETLCWPESMGMAVRLVPNGPRESILTDDACWQDSLPANTTAIFRMEKDKPLRSNILQQLERLGE